MPPIVLAFQSIAVGMFECIKKSGKLFSFAVSSLIYRMAKIILNVLQIRVRTETMVVALCEVSP